MFAWDDLQQPFYIVITADEEVGFHGARTVVEQSKLYREMVTHGTKAVIGEPTSLEVVHAHKGSVEIKATTRGSGGHSSARTSINSNLAMIPFLNEIKTIQDETETDVRWQNSLFDPPTLSCNIRIKDDSPALNITPAKTICTMFWRTMPKVDLDPLLQRVHDVAKQHGVELEVRSYGRPMMTNPNSEFVQQALKLAHRPKAKTVSYGTDGGIFSELEQKIVFGPGSIAQAHTNNEWISLEQLNSGTEMFAKMVRHWCCQKG
jgi:acetylornithine deacetylase